jgi:hypothetical protein
MFKDSKFLILHVFIFILFNTLGALNIITDMLITLSTPHDSLADFSVNDFFASYAVIYIGQYIVTALAVSSLMILIAYKASKQIIGFKLTISPWLTHSILSIMISCSILSLNSYFFPGSLYISLFTIENSQAALAIIILIATCCLLAAINTHKFFPIVILILVPLSYLPLSHLPLSHDTYPATPEKPNIFIIGIDSLRPELINKYMPYLNQQLKESTVFSNSFTPFARTYPSWISILTGKHPSNNGARFNLQPESQLNPSNQYLPQILSHQGYHSIYASDERRFSNLGITQGFSEVIGPRTGASDFLLGNYADYPLTNLLTFFPAAKWLLPELYANRAAAHLYKPSAFSELLDSKLQNTPNKPLFLATHFCLPHWPYSYAGSELEMGYPQKPAYPGTLKAVDLQIKSLMLLLEKTGRLKNSRIIFLSDHGESWGKVRSNLFLNKEELMINDHGHGMNILSPSSHKVLIGLKGFNQYDPNIHRLASLIDISPTIIDDMGIAGIKMDGKTLLKPAIEPIEISFESGLVLAEANKANPNPEEVAKAAAARFSILPSGYLRLREHQLTDMLRRKQVGLRIDNKGIFKLGVNEPYIEVDYKTNKYSKNSSLPSDNKYLATRFCELFYSHDVQIKKECDTK